jgi:hypothetical protein
MQALESKASIARRDGADKLPPTQKAAADMVSGEQVLNAPRLFEFRGAWRRHHQPDDRLIAADTETIEIRSSAR